ncbi:MAG: hypothetical protein HJJLKODD_00519 [Phycisphaerae bacterium]|nr:hypothetical protein [Phycisphaerae bacterium]
MVLMMDMQRSQRGLVLPVILVVILLLAVLVASFSFQVNAQLARANADRTKVQLRMAAEAGLHHAMLLLRTERANPAAWYDNEELFHNRVVWSERGDEAQRNIPETIDRSSQTYRYTLVADDPNDDLTRVRYGISDENSKLNINFATREQLLVLFSQILPPEQPATPLVDALIDWRDQDDEPGAEGAERDYYLSLPTPYEIKNNLFETIDELLMVRGLTGQLLYGEDYDRNGLLSPNEDDGETRFPPDNQDGRLNRGLYPYITVWSRDLNRSNDNISRIDLNMPDIRKLEEELLKYLSPEVVDYIVTARRNDVTFSSPVELLGHTFTSGGKQPTSDPSPPAGDENGDRVDEPPAADGDNPVPQEEGGGMEFSSPVTVEDLPMLCDYTTTVRLSGMMGQININTAPVQVLRCLVNGTFTDEHVAALVAARQTLAPEKLATVAWPATELVIPEEAFQSIYPQITARSQQFHIEAIGHADHTGMMVRLEVIAELRGQVPQVMYYRDLGELGAAWSIIRGTGEGDNVARTAR